MSILLLYLPILCRGEKPECGLAVLINDCVWYHHIWTGIQTIIFCPEVGVDIINMSIPFQRDTRSHVVLA
jgi:hypothetical protein